MTPDEIRAKVRNLVRETGTKADLHDDMLLFYDAMTGDHHAALDRGEAGLDSLDSVELVLAIEEAFGIDIPDADVEDNPEWTTIAGIAAYVERRLTQEKN